MENLDIISCYLMFHELKRFPLRAKQGQAEGEPKPCYKFTSTVGDSRSFKDDHHDHRPRCPKIRCGLAKSKRKTRMVRPLLSLQSHP